MVVKRAKMEELMVPWRGADVVVDVML